MNAEKKHEINRCNQISLLRAIARQTLADTNDLLSLTVEDVTGKEYLTFHVGQKSILRTCCFSDIMPLISRCTEGRSSSEYLFNQCKADDLDRDQIAADWVNHYFSETGDIYYPMELLELTEPEIRTMLN